MINQIFFINKEKSSNNITRVITMPPAAGTSLKPVRRMLAPKTFPNVEGGDLTRDLDLAQDEFVALLELTQQVKASPARFSQSLKGQYLSLLFEKPSLRTRVSTLPDASAEASSLCRGMGALRPKAL